MLRRLSLIAMTTQTNIAVVVFGHAVAAIALILGKAGYGGRPYGILGSLADHSAWALIHVSVAFALVFAANSRHLAVAASASASVMGGWSLLMLWWAASLQPNATWLVGLLGLVAAAHSVVIADKAARQDED